jgi:xanthosine utilization system XapX-like protein
MIEHLLESAQIEAIANVFLVDFAEELMILEVTKPADPSVALFGTVGLAVRHYN